jgi:membrane-associated protease RseP (regulator of RpoE activity)
MLLFWLGAAAFALTILISVSLHELGHMITGKRFGMKVTQYFVGFGPTLFSFRRGETEYGLKLIPLGGFCKIVGMTPQDDDVAPEDQPRAMWRFPVWKRTIVMGAGSVTHFILAAAGIWIMAITVGLPNQDFPTTNSQQLTKPARIDVAECTWISLPTTNVDCKPGTDGAIAGPAAAAGLKDGDLINRVGTVQINNYGDLTNAIRVQKPGEVPFEYTRDGNTTTVNVNLISAKRPAPSDDTGTGPQTDVPIAGLGLDTSGIARINNYNVASAVPASASFGWLIVENSFASLKKVPEKIPALWHSLTGGERDPNTPISVIGASRLGGEAIQKGVPEVFWQIFISLNVFIGIFNLLPLLPLDGGHIAIAWYEKARSWLYARLRKKDPGRVDYYKLMPITYAVILIGGAFTLLTATADIVNPIRIFP